MNLIHLRRPASLLCAVVIFTVLSESVRCDDRADFFEKSVRPLLIKKCAECHTGETPEGDLLIDDIVALKKGGMNGPAVVSGKPDQSLLLQRILTDDANLLMPPDERLSDEQISVLKKWIAGGAFWPESEHGEWANEEDRAAHWAFQEVQNVAPPDVGDSEWSRTPIDRFIAARHAEHNVIPVAVADRRTLIRRATLDLTGLPPTPEEVATFVADETENAMEKLVDRLLSSKHYGERWGRHWLDLARYADTSGDGTDMPIPEARYYRDYVIRAFNDDLPYNEFIVEQIAGDLQAEADPKHARYNERIIATGYIALSRRFGNSKFADMNLIVDDTVDTIGKSMMGLTLGCARCHHHKFDPVTTDDYYGLYGYFENTEYPHAGTEHQKERSGMVALCDDDRKPSSYESAVAWAVTDKEKLVGDIKTHIGGDPRNRGKVAPRAFLSVMSKDVPDVPADSSGRLHLANWIASPENSLTTRVIVNRVWQYHFGKGIVASSSNFGLQGNAPTHPELLDWVTRDFVANGWSLKHLHKRIMLSSVYQLASEPNVENLKGDEGNVWRWRFDRRRMDAESIRDSLLAVSGLLEDGDNGRHPFAPTEKLRYSQGRPFDKTFDHNHRSVYLMTARLSKHPFLALFDGPDPNKTTASRRESTVASQALFMMNSEFLKKAAAAFANRVLSVADQNEDRIDRAYQLAFGRSPSAAELADVQSFVSDYQREVTASGGSAQEAELVAWSALARVTLSSSEFLYVD